MVGHDRFVNLGPNIWRFRNVRTVEDCIKAREQWVAEAHAALQPSTPVVSTYFYHVRVSTKSSQRWGEVVFDLSEDELESRILVPYRTARSFMMRGKVIAADDVTQIRINRSEQPSADLRSALRASYRGRFRTASDAAPEDWQVADQGEDVTDQFITEPPRGAAVQVAVPAPQAAALPEPVRYVDQTVVDAIRAKAVAGSLDVTKLLSLIEELNSNHAHENTYASHGLLRAILDHVPPILGLKTFNEVPSNYPWGKTDIKYMKKLLEFKLQADDALHRAISSKPDLLTQEDMPPRVWVNRLLQECADKL